MEKAKEPGRGRKQCPQCKYYIGVRNAKCDCGYEFDASNASKPQKVMSVPASTESIGTKPANPTPIAVNPDVKKEEKDPKLWSHKNMTVYVPAGHCPIKPKGYKAEWPDGPCSDEDVSDWAFSVKNYSPPSTSDYGHLTLTKEAVMYWARQFWDLNGKDFPRIRRLISENFD